jgi:ferredoxin
MTLVARSLPTDTMIVVDGQRVQARIGESLASALLTTGRWAALYCGMGACYTCQVTLDGRPTLACLERVRPGMVVDSMSDR